MTRADFEKLPNRPERMWLKEMQEMTDNLRTMFDRVDAKEAPEVDVEKINPHSGRSRLHRRPSRIPG